MTRAGVHNVIWSWVSTGYLGNAAAIKAGWPGSKYVDWIGYDPYNLDGCLGRPWRTPMQIFAPFYRWTSHQQGMRHKPLLLSEYGSVLNKGVYGWYASIPSALAQLPRLKALIQFSAPTASGCDTTLSHSSAAVAGFAKAGNSPAVTGSSG
jgi:beta-mannanase